MDVMSVTLQGSLHETAAIITMIVLIAIVKGATVLITFQIRILANQP